MYQQRRSTTGFGFPFFFSSFLLIGSAQRTWRNSANNKEWNGCFGAVCLLELWERNGGNPGTRVAWFSLPSHSSTVCFFFSPVLFFVSGLTIPGVLLFLPFGQFGLGVGAFKFARGLSCATT
jgi:hypothetical protein